MKTTNTIFLLVVALAVLGAIYFTKQKEEQTFTSAAIPETTIPAVTSGTLERIVIDAPDQKEITLTKVDDQWYTNVERRYEADSNAVTAALRALQEPVQATVVSSNPDSFDDYHVSDTSGTKVNLFEKDKTDPVLSMIIGKDGPSAFSTYVRLNDDEEVLNARASLSMSFKRPDGWRDKQVFNFSGSTATRIEQGGTSATFTAVRSEDDTWNFEGEPGGEADNARMNSMANMMASLRANQFIEPAESQFLADFGLEPARQSITLTYNDKTTSPSKPTTVSLLVGNESNTPGDWYAKRLNKPDVFTIGTHVAESLSPDPESLKVTPPEPDPAPEPEVDTTATTETRVAEEVTTEATAPPVGNAPETTGSETRIPGPDAATTESAPAITASDQGTIVPATQPDPAAAASTATADADPQTTAP